VLAARLTETMS